jgi:hypothetical protein
VLVVDLKMSELGYKFVDVEPSLKNLTADFGKIPDKQNDVCRLSVIVISVFLLILWYK